VDETLEHLAGNGFLDDARYARKMAAQLVEHRMLGPQRIIQKLIHKGIPRDLVDLAVSEMERGFPAAERAKKLLQNKMKNRTPIELSPGELIKLRRYLYQRGFSWETMQEIFHLAGGFTEG
jgi:regulatory protein